MTIMVSESESLLEEQVSNVEAARTDIKSLSLLKNILQVEE